MAGIKLSPKQRSELAQALLSRGMATPQRTTSPWQNLGRVLNVIAGRQQMTKATEDERAQNAQLAESLLGASQMSGGVPATTQVQNPAGQFTVNTPGGGMSPLAAQLQQVIGTGGPLGQQVGSQMAVEGLAEERQARAAAEAALRAAFLKRTEGDYSSARDFQEAVTLKQVDAHLREPPATWRQLDPSEFSRYKLPPNTIMAQLNEKSGKVEAKTDSGFEFEVGPDGTIRAASGSGIRRTQSNEIKLKEKFDFYNDAVNDLDALIGKVEADPTLLGAVGAVRKAGQSVFGIGSDIADVVGVDLMRNVINDVAGRVSADKDLPEEIRKEFFDDPDLSTMRLFEHHIGYMLARARQPTGRMLADTIKRAMEDAKLTGLVSSKDAFRRLQMVRNMMARSRDQYAVMRAGGEPRAKRMIYNEATGEFEEER